MENTQTTLKFFKELAMINFRPLNAFDYEAFAGASHDAVIGEVIRPEMIQVISEIIEAPVALKSLEGSTVVIISGGRVEVFGTHSTPLDGEEFTFTFDFNPIAL